MIEVGTPAPRVESLELQSDTRGLRHTLAGLLTRGTTELAARLDLPYREARLEAQVLAAHALGVTRTWLIAHDREPLSTSQAGYVQQLINRRLDGEPVSYILGYREFYGRRFRVTPDVLIPRPETELLVEAALSRLPPDRPASILDLGTGSGCVAISLALARPDCKVTAVDISTAALDVARDNANTLGARVYFLHSDWFSAVSGQVFDLIVGNPPYVADSDPHLDREGLPHEPRSALVAGRDGLDAIRIIASHGHQHLSSGGGLMIEHGHDQDGAIGNLLTVAGYTSTQTIHDLAGLPRITFGSRPDD